jgi:hypothetical protein
MGKCTYTLHGTLSALVAALWKNAPSEEGSGGSKDQVPVIGHPAIVANPPAYGGRARPAGGQIPLPVPGVQTRRESFLA